MICRCCFYKRTWLSATDQWRRHKQRKESFSWVDARMLPPTSPSIFSLLQQQCLNRTVTNMFSSVRHVWWLHLALVTLIWNLERGHSIACFRPDNSSSPRRPPSYRNVPQFSPATPRIPSPCNTSPRHTAFLLAWGFFSESLGVISHFFVYLESKLQAFVLYRWKEQLY